MIRSRSMTRRSAIRTIGKIGAGSALGAAIGTAGARAALSTRDRASGGGPVGKAEIFALVGDRFHNFDYIRTALYRTLVKESGRSVVFTPDTTLLTAETLRAHRLLLMLCDGLSFPGGYSTPYIFYDPEKMKIVSDPPLSPALDETAAMWITPEQGKAIKNFVAGGGSAWFFHNASYISGANKDFRDVEGALFTGHTPFRPYKMKIVNRDHPITRGVNDFVVSEEQHYLLYDKDPKAVLIRSVNEEGLEYSTPATGNQGATCEACWAYEYGKGRVCFMAPGHTIMSFWNPEYIKLQKNAVRWLLRET
jgi:type 1 glutamine amidotransferase